MVLPSRAVSAGSGHAGLLTILELDTARDKRLPDGCVLSGTAGASLGGEQAGAARGNLFRVIYGGYPKLAGYRGPASMSGCATGLRCTNTAQSGGYFRVTGSFKAQ